MMRRKMGFGAAAAVAFVVFAGGATAQPQLQGAEPARNATAEAPDHLLLHFSEPLDAKLSSARVELTAGPRAAGAQFGGKPTVGTTANGVDAADAQSLRIVFAKPLTTGLYTVSWRAGSADGKLTRGQYSFYVK